ncbi:MAG: efflux RND transporter periplasmic adaptor subunit [Rhodospirillales bacterium]|nr:efflux RND transporter periplasmic adaptor subunit [Rhodospirillales bacterium]MBN8898490.1 efflux RND transporter periplasmic adaptor subunit [Rhodospirillales bacterium]
MVLAAGAIAVWQHGDAAPAAAQSAPPPPSVTVSNPLEREVSAWTRFTGQFSAVDEVDLRAQVSGYLSEIHFTDGQIVHKGDLLFVIDPRPFEIQLQEATAQYQTAAASLDLAQRQLQRTSELQRSDFASRDVLDQRVQAQKSAIAAMEQAKAAIRSAQLNIEFSRITAPFTGRIGAHQVSIGSLVNGGTGANSTLLATVVSLDPIHVDFDMSESDYLSWRRYQQEAGNDADKTVELALTDEQGWPRRGVLDFVDNKLDRGSGTMHARATVPNPDLLVAPGQFARVRLPTQAARVALLVPDAAVATDQSNKLVMTVAEDGTVVPKRVQLGGLHGGLRVVTGGLEKTDRVVINGLMRARPGGKVTPQPGAIAVAVN